MFGLKGKILTTLALFAKSITLGCGSNFFPFVIEEMRIKLNTDQETILKIYKIFANASLAGTLGGIIVFRIIRRQLGTMYILVGISVLMIMIPNSPNIDYFNIFVGILGVLVGLIVPGQIVWTMEMWQKKSTPILQALMFCFSIGQALPEYITAPFLRVHPLEIGKNNILNETNVQIVELPNTANNSETIDILEFKNFTENIVPNTSNQTQEFSNIHIPFAIVGVMSFFNAWFERILFKDFTYEAPPPPGAKPKPGENNDEAYNKDEPENQAAKSTNLQNQDPPPDESDDKNDSSKSSEEESSASDESDDDNDSSPDKESDETDNEPMDNEVDKQSIKSSKQFLEKIPMKALKAPLTKSAVKMKDKARIIMMQKKVIANTKATKGESNDAKGEPNAAKGDLKALKDVVNAAKGEEKATKGDAKSVLEKMKPSVIDTTKSNIGGTNVSQKWKSAAAKTKNMTAFQKKLNKSNIGKTSKKLMKIGKMAKDKMGKEKEKDEKSEGSDEEYEEMKKTESNDTKKEGKKGEDEKCEKEYEEKENDDDESEHEDEPTDDVPLLTKENDTSDAESEISIEFCKDDETGEAGKDNHSISSSIAEEERSYSTQDTEITGPFSEEEKENDKTTKEKSISDSETESTKEDATSRATVIEKDKATEKENEVDEKCEKHEEELQTKEAKSTSNENKDEIKDTKPVEDNNAKAPEDDTKKSEEEVKDTEEQEKEDEGGLKGKVQGCIKKLKLAKKIVMGVWKMVSSPEGRKVIYVLALSSCVFGAYAAIEKCSKETLSKLAQEGNLKLDEEKGALVLQGFTTSFMWGRFAGMVVALILSPFTIMCVDLSLIFLGNFTIIFGASFDMWVMTGGCVLLGLGLSTLYAGLFTYLCGQINFTDVIGAILVVASTIATNFYSEWIEKFIGGDSQKLTSANYISGLVCTIGFKIIYSITKPKRIPQDLEDVVIA